MATVDRRGKSKTAALLSTIAAMGKENYDSAYAMWKMGAPVKELAQHYGVPEMHLDYSFELRLIHESNE